MSIIDRSVIKQYGDLWDYCHEFLTFNPGSTVKMQCMDIGGAVSKFQRLYICLDACKKGFIAGCRPIVGVDGCFIRAITEDNF